MAQIIFNAVSTSNRNFFLNQYIIFKSNLVSKREGKLQFWEKSSTTDLFDKEVQMYP